MSQRAENQAKARDLTIRLGGDDPNAPMKGTDGLFLDQHRCTARRKRTKAGCPVCSVAPRGEPPCPACRCRRQRVEPTTKCRLHGGESLRGAASPRWVHGEDSAYARSIPGRYKRVYQKALQNKDITSLHDTIALLEARLNELLSILDTGESGSLWSRASAIGREIESLDAEVDEAAADVERASGLTLAKQERAAERLDQLKARRRSLTQDLLRVIREGSGEIEKWEDLLKTIEMRRRLSDTERRKMEAMQAYMTPDQALALVARISGIIKRNVQDRSALNNIAREFEELLPTKLGSHDPLDEPTIVDVTP